MADRLKLDVSGQIFTILRQQLVKGPPSKLVSICQTSSSTIYIDRPVDSFSVVLTLYQTGEIHIPSSVCPVLLLKELNYWGISPTYISKCCFERLESYMNAQEAIRDFKKYHKQRDPIVKTSCCSSTRKFRSKIWKIVDYTEPSLAGMVYFFISLVMVFLSILAIAYSEDPTFTRELTTCENIEYILATDDTIDVTFKEIMNEFCLGNDTSLAGFNVSTKNDKDRVKIEISFNKNDENSYPGDTLHDWTERQDDAPPIEDMIIDWTTKHDKAPPSEDIINDWTTKHDKAPPSEDIINDWTTEHDKAPPSEDIINDWTTKHDKAPPTEDMINDWTTKHDKAPPTEDMMNDWTTEHDKSEPNSKISSTLKTDTTTKSNLIGSLLTSSMHSAKSAAIKHENEFRESTEVPPGITIAEFDWTTETAAKFDWNMSNLNGDPLNISTPNFFHFSLTLENDTFFLPTTPLTQFLSVHVLEKDIPYIKIKVYALVVCGIITALFFTFDFIIRLVSCPCIFRYFTSVINIFDALALVSTHLHMILIFLYRYEQYNNTWLKVLEYSQMARACRLLRTMDNVRAGKILTYSIKRNKGDLLTIGLFLVTGMCVFASCFYLSEERNNVHTLLEAWYWAIITMTTVGYGDIVPKTFVGRMFATLCAVTGVLMLALTVPIFANNFFTLYNHVHFKDRKRKIKRWQAFIDEDLNINKVKHRTSQNKLVSHRSLKEKSCNGENA